MHVFQSILRQKPKPDPINLSNIRVASPCPADWEKMVGDERVRHCAECNLNVYNLSAMTERQVQELIAGSRGKRLCTRFYRRADGTVLTQDCPWSLRAMGRNASRIAAGIIAAMMSIGVAFGKNNSRQSSSQAAANHQAKRGVWITVVDPQGALVPGADVRLIGSSGKEATHAKPAIPMLSFSRRFPAAVIKSSSKHRDFISSRSKLSSKRTNLRTSRPHSR